MSQTTRNLLPDTSPTRTNSGPKELLLSRQYSSNKVTPEKLHEIIDCYEAVVTNLNCHVHLDFPYPSADYMSSIVRSGAPVIVTEVDRSRTLY